MLHKIRLPKQAPSRWLEDDACRPSDSAAGHSIPGTRFMATAGAGMRVGLADTLTSVVVAFPGIRLAVLFLRVFL